MPIIELDSIDSTNNYAMRLIDADTAHHGLCITANYQTAGKGQRGKQWDNAACESLLMSIVVVPGWKIDQQFLLSATVAVAVADVLTTLHPTWNVAIKWPNDIFINDKKTAGILIENVLRGPKWQFAVIGIGLNVLQPEFPLSLPHASSLLIQSGKKFALHDLRDSLLSKIMEALTSPSSPEQIITSYNDYLYRKGCKQQFSNEEKEWSAIIKDVTIEGKLNVIDEEGASAIYLHGNQQWCLGR